MESEEWLNMMLENESFEDLLERFDIGPQEVFECLINNGLIDLELFKELKRG